MNIVRIRRDAVFSMERHARDGYPNEVAGVVGLDHGGCIVEAVPLATGMRDSVRICQTELTDAQAALVRGRLRYGGTYHSHPDSRAYPTQADRMLLDHADYMLIVSVAYDELRVFRRAQATHHPAEVAVALE